MDEVELSKSKVDRAGAALREWWNDNADLERLSTDPELNAAVETLIEWRAAHRTPLLLAQFQLGSAVQEVVEGAVPTGRHKRTGQIIYKLVRHPTMRLSQMEDITGTRVVVPTQAEVAQVLERLLPRFPGAQVIDYVAKPKPTGYRAIHVVVKQQDRLVEIQLRTQRQNVWADEVERWADALGFELKDGRGPDDLVEYFNLGAAMLAATDQGAALNEDLARALADVRERVRPYFERGGRTD